MNIPKVLSSEEVYKGKIISIRKDTLTRGDGKNFIRETAVSSDAVAVVAMDEQRRILMIRQYRHPMGQPVWEIPAGSMRELYLAGIIILTVILSMIQEKVISIL